MTTTQQQQQQTPVHEAALARCRQPDGSYRIADEWHVVTARAE